MPVFNSYTVEWEDKAGEEHQVRVSARSASEAWEKARIALAHREDFKEVFWAEITE